MSSGNCMERISIWLECVRLNGGVLKKRVGEAGRILKGHDCHTLDSKDSGESAKDLNRRVTSDLSEF